MRAIVFGGSGFLGSHVADELQRKGHEVVIFDKSESKYLRQGQQMILGDILDRQQVWDAVAGCDFVYNYAGIADLDDASTRPADTVILNVAGTCNILDACVENRVRRFVYASSFYTNSGKGGFYRCSKQSAEIYIEEYERKHGIAYTILRYGSLYGPRAEKNNGMRDMVAQAMTEEDDVEIYTSGATNILKYPELSDKEKASELLYTLEEKKELTTLLSNRMEDEETRGIQVYIGNETTVESMKDCSVVTATYEIQEGVYGKIGIVGPKRMDYERVVSTLQNLMTQLDEIFKENSQE